MLHEVQLEEILEQVVHSGGHMLHLKKVELSIEFVGQL
jgi:hypothetical protein